VGPDTTCWTEWDRSWAGEGDEERVCVPTSDVHKIIVHRRLRGGFQGAGIGLGAGVAAAVAAGFAMAPGLEGNDMGGVVVVYLGAIGVSVGTVVGAVVGVNRGKDVYVLNS